MNTVIPEDQGIRKAIQWIDDARQDHLESKVIQLIDQAGMRFNLSPSATEFLVRFYLKKNT